MRLQTITIITFCFAVLCLSGCVRTLQTPSDLHTVSGITAEKASKVSKQNLSSLHDFEAVGKIGFSDGKQGGNASIYWEQHPNAYQVRLYGPLGSGSLQIMGNTSGDVRLLREDGKIIRAKTPEALVHDELGWVIPVSGLRYWLRGLPAPGAPPTRMALDAEQRIWQIQQQGWSILYESYQSLDGLDVPYKLTLKNGPIRLKFIFRRWERLSLVSSPNFLA